MGLSSAVVIMCWIYFLEKQHHHFCPPPPREIYEKSPISNLKYPLSPHPSQVAFIMFIFPGERAESRAFPRFGEEENMNIYFKGVQSFGINLKEQRISLQWLNGSLTNDYREQCSSISFNREQGRRSEIFERSTEHAIPYSPPPPVPWEASDDIPK